jgi:hypothetical protein
MFEDSYLDSFMESHIGGWTGDEDYWYATDRDEGCDPYDDCDDDEEFWDEQDNSVENADLDLDQSDY